MDYINNNYDDLHQIVSNITKGHQDTDDLMSEVILQIAKKPPKIQEDQFKYYFIRVVKNNWFSKTSRFHYNVRRKLYDHNVVEDNTILENIEEDEPYVENTPTLEWVKKEVDNMFWFKRDLFLLWLDLGTLTQLSKNTTIPLNTCSRYIREIKQELQERWDSQQQY